MVIRSGGQHPPPGYAEPNRAPGTAFECGGKRGRKRDLNFKRRQNHAAEFFSCGVAPQKNPDDRPGDAVREPVLMDLANAGSEFDAGLTLHMVHTSPFTEGAFRRRSVAERGWRRLQAGFAPSSQEARSPSGPDEGPAFSGLDNIG